MCTLCEIIKNQFRKTNFKGEMKKPSDIKIFSILFTVSILYVFVIQALIEKCKKHVDDQSYTLFDYLSAWKWILEQKYVNKKNH